ncbi:hypothetical protein BDZ88DRAFT_468248 [Geranomyces variabilis]|nr:hypothetical protein BDZ88DRAFT_468248 [Geranomyces variabilis]
MATPTSLSALVRQHEADTRMQSCLSTRLQNIKQVMTFGQIVALKVIRQSGISNKRLCALIQGWGFEFTPPLAVNQMPTASHTVSVSVAVARTTASQHESEKRIKASLSARLANRQTMTMGQIATLKVVRECRPTVPRLCTLIRSWGYAFSPPLAANEMPQASHIVATYSVAERINMDTVANIRSLCQYREHDQHRLSFKYLLRICVRR